MQLITKLLQSADMDTKDLFTGEGGLYSFINPVSYLDARKNKELFSQMTGIFADGTMMAVVLSIIRFKRVPRYSFDMTSLAKVVFSYAETQHKSIYLVGGKEEEIEKTILVFKQRWTNMNVVGFRHGYFVSDQDKEDTYQRILESKADFLIVGMGIIKQEIFMIELKNRGFQGRAFSCGGFLSQSGCGKIDYYPYWIDRLNLRYLYRFCKEKHTRKRYILASFLFPIYFTKDCFFDPIKNHLKK